MVSVTGTTGMPAAFASSWSLRGDGGDGLLVVDQHLDLLPFTWFSAVTTVSAGGSLPSAMAFWNSNGVRTFSPVGLAWYRKIVSVRPTGVPFHRALSWAIFCRMRPRESWKVWRFCVNSAASRVELLQTVGHSVGDDLDIVHVVPHMFIIGQFRPAQDRIP